MNEQTFDGITFHSDSELINFLKQSYYAQRSTIRALETDRDKYFKDAQTPPKCEIEGCGKDADLIVCAGHVP